MAAMKSHALLVALIALVCPLGHLHAHGVAAEMAQAATNLLAALKPEQRAQATFPLTDAERENWHFIPRPRKGISWRELSLSQQHLAQVLVASPLSHRGNYQVQTIMSLEEILHQMQNRNPIREPGQYYLSIFGAPGIEPWGWRLEGHHLSLNFLVAHGGAIATSPAFFGANPAEVRTGPRTGLRVLEREEELGWQLVRSLDAKQAALAVIATNAPDDILTGTNRRISRLEPAGISGRNLNAKQLKLLRELIAAHVRRSRPELAEVELQKIAAAGEARLFFAWAGGLAADQGHYYRIQGPHFIIEFDNTQNQANHIHTVWRDLENDFGDDLLRRHYEQSPHKR
jgi:hypothetical protein